jgi:hypothetical protein
LNKSAVINPVTVLLALCLAWLPAAVFAAPGSLYEAEVEVSDDGAEARKQGIVTALGVVVTKVTGRAAPESLAAWPRLSAAAEGLLVEYRYRTAAPLDIDDPLSPPRTMLSIRFDRAGLDRLLQDEQIPLWGDTRPATLLLVAVERGTERFIYTPDQLPEAAAAIASASDRRGIPLVEPLMDLEDRAMLRFTEVWAGFPEVIEQAAARYRPDGVLVARLFGEGEGLWRAQWTLHVGLDRDSWESRGTLSTTFDDGIGRLADRLAQRFVPDPAATGEQRVAFDVVGIEGPADYGRVMAFLSGLTAVQGLWPVMASHEVLELEVTTDVEPEALLRTIGLGGLLVQLDLPATPGTEETPRFRLRP